MKMVGIPIEDTRCKVIVTSRSIEVCMRMGLRMLKQIDPLSDEEAWSLFMETLGHDLPINVKMIAKAVVRECDGLPLGIVTMAGSARAMADTHEWNNALRELRGSEVRPEDMGDVFRILRFSYTCLNDWPLQQCFLYCAMFPEDCDIDREELIEFLIAEGILEQRSGRQMNFDKGHAMLNKLVKVSLLEDVKKGGHCKNVNMHDLIRDMAIQILKECSPSIIEAGRQLKHIPKEIYWEEDIVRVSLMINDISEIPCSYSPARHTLSTLLLSVNMKLKSIPDSFFPQFLGLKVLDLSNTGIEKVPESVSCLENLKALLLRGCFKLVNMPSLAKLVSLEMLDLSFCRALEQVPEGLELLINLPFLNLFGSGLKLRSGMIGRLSHLQFLSFGMQSESSSQGVEAEDRPGLQMWEYFNWYFLDAGTGLMKLVSGMLTGLSHLKYLANGFLGVSSGVKAEELAKLQNLESLTCCFHDFGEYNQFVELVYKMQLGKQITNYCLSVGRGDILESTKYIDRPSSREVNFHKCYVKKEVFILKDLQILRMKNVTLYDGNGLRLETASHMNSFDPELKFLAIANCEGIEYLFHLSSSPSVLEVLETLELTFLPKLHALFGEEVAGPGTAVPLLPCATTFSRLKRFVISRCNTMKSLFTLKLFSNFQNLEDIVVQYCSEMEVIAAAEDEVFFGDDPSSSFYNYDQIDSFYDYDHSDSFRNFDSLSLNEYNDHSYLTETSHFNLSKLRSLTLEQLPKLKSICSGKVWCDSLKQFTVRDCESLRNIPISLPLCSLQTLRVQPKEWWYSVQWGNPLQKSMLQPEFDSC